MNLIDAPTIPQLARALLKPDGTRGVGRRGLFKRLMVQHARDRKEAGAAFVPWLFRSAPRGRWRVNVSRLRRAHPELFEVPTLEGLDGRVSRLELRADRSDAAHRARRDEVRRLGERVDRIERAG